MRELRPAPSLLANGFMNDRPLRASVRATLTYAAEDKPGGPVPGAVARGAGPELPDGDLGDGRAALPVAGDGAQGRVGAPGVLRPDPHGDNPGGPGGHLRAGGAAAVEAGGRRRPGPPGARVPRGRRRGAAGEVAPRDAN